MASKLDGGLFHVAGRRVKIPVERVRREPHAGKRRLVWTASSPKTRPKWVWLGLIDLSTMSNRSTQEGYSVSRRWIIRTSLPVLATWGILSKTSRARTVWKTWSVMWIKRKRSEEWSSSPLYWLLRLSIPKSASPMTLSGPFLLHLSSKQTVMKLLTALFPALFLERIAEVASTGQVPEG